MNFKYYIPTKILFGRGQLANLHKEKLPGTRALIVTTGGRSVVDNGYLARTEEELKAAGCTFVLFNKITANPDRSEVMDGAALAKAENCDFIVGLGGGSPIDAAKAIAVMATNPGDYWDYMVRGTGGGRPVSVTPPEPERKLTRGRLSAMLRPAKNLVSALTAHFPFWRWLTPS